jgi:hypothetical protein
MTTDPRKAKTLGEAALNPDGKTYNGARALSWLSAAVGGNGLPEEEVRRIWEEVKARKAAEAKR